MGNDVIFVKAVTISHRNRHRSNFMGKNQMNYSKYQKYAASFSHKIIQLANPMGKHAPQCFNKKASSRFLSHSHLLYINSMGNSFFYS